MSSPAHIEIAPGLFLPRGALQWSFSRGSGPGGQNVNKVSSRVQLRVAMQVLESLLGQAAAGRLREAAGARLTESDELLLTCDDSRSQRANRETCLRRLRGMIVSARRVPRVRKATRPSRRAKAQRMDDKTRRARMKQMRRRPHDES